MASLNKICSVEASLDCKVESSPKLIFKIGKSSIFKIKVSVKRTSDILDYFYVQYSSDLGIILHKDDYIYIKGDIRTLNKGNTDFVIEGYVHAKSIEVLNVEPESYRNDIVITNAILYKFNEVRKSYNDNTRNVTDYQVKLDRGRGRYSYFKVTSWGKDAVTIGTIHNDIKLLNLKCRLRSYISKRNGNLYLYLVSYDFNAKT